MADNNTKAKSETSQKKVIVIVAVVLLVVVLGIGAFFLVKNNTKEKALPTNAPVTSAIETTQAVTTEAPPAKDINPLTGLTGLDENSYGKRPIAVVVENSPAARPQWGLCSPDIVIEGIVEGGITRMLWLYADVNSIPKVGPVRSARHDFVEMAEGLNAVFVHSGGSWTAYDVLKRRNVDHVDGMSGKYFFRDKSRNVASEHTLYTNGESIAKSISALKINTQIDMAYWAPFKFTTAATPGMPSSGVCQNVSFAFSSSYKHMFKFNATDKLYYNYMNAKPMVEDGGKQMAVTNVIILYLPVFPWNDTQGHMELDLTDGKGVFVANGGYENITWKKGTPNDMLLLYSSDGSDLKLNPGKSYIGYVPTSQAGNTVYS